METKTQGLLQELEVTKSLLSQKTEEAEKWALKYTQSEELRIKELQVLKGQFESYTKTNIVSVMIQNTVLMVIIFQFIRKLSKSKSNLRLSAQLTRHRSCSFGS